MQQVRGRFGTYRSDSFEPHSHITFGIAYEQVPQCRELRAHARRSARVYRNVDSPRTAHKRPPAQLVPRTRGKGCINPGNETARKRRDDSRSDATSVREPKQGDTVGNGKL